MPGPNILLLFSDQHRGDFLGAYGARWVHSPSLDDLAADGVLYTNAYTHVPVCVAARYGILTGRRARETGFFSNWGPGLDPSIPTLPLLLSDAGYVTQAIGKMHWQPPRRHHGFDRMLLMEETPETREEDDYLLYLKSVGYGHIRHAHGVRHLLYHQPQRSLLPEEHQGTRWVAERVIEFLRAHRNRRWFLWAGWIAPHPPFNAADRWAEFYTGREVPDPIRSPQETLPERLVELRFLADIDPDNLPLIRRCRELYCAQISFLDEQIGRILDELDRLGLRNDTLVIYTSDHGELLGDHWGWQKQVAYEGSVRVPLVVRFPGGPAGERLSPFVDLLDIFPTICDLAGIPLPGEYPGGSLRMVAEGTCTARDRTVQFFHFGHDWRRRFLGVRDERYKLAYWVRDGFEEFYDLKNDPGELHNLRKEGMDGEASAAYRRLRRMLTAFERDHGPAGLEGGELPRRASEGPVLQHNAQFPAWPHNLADPEERARMNSVEEEILAAVKKEPPVKLSALDLDAWVAAGGSAEFAREVRNKGL